MGDIYAPSGRGMQGTPVMVNLIPLEIKVVIQLDVFVKKPTFLSTLKVEATTALCGSHPTNALSSLLSFLSLSLAPQDPLDHYPLPRHYNGLDDYRETDPYSHNKVPYYLPTPLPPENAAYPSPYTHEPPTFRPPIPSKSAPRPPPTTTQNVSPNPGLYLTPDIQKSPLRPREPAPVPRSPLPHPRPVLPEPEPFDDGAEELSNFFDEPFGQDDPGNLDYSGEPMPSAQPYSAKPYHPPSPPSPPGRQPSPPPSPESYYKYPPPGTYANKYLHLLLPLFVLIVMVKMMGYGGKLSTGWPICFGKEICRQQI